MYVMLPLSIGLAAAGCFMLLRKAGAHEFEVPAGPRHPVTAEMAKETGNWAKKKAPPIETTTLAGSKWSFAFAKGKPVFVYFIKKGCPCSTDAEPLFQKLYEQHKGKVEFVGVITSGAKDAKEWQEIHKTPYNILLDEKATIARSYQAKNSVYSALINPDGTIERMWPGYSRDILKAINAVLAAASNQPEKVFDAGYAPIEKSSGCSLYGEE